MFLKVNIETLEFSSLERKIYDSIWQKVKQNFDQLEAKGLIGKNYTHILAMLMRSSNLWYLLETGLILHTGCVVPYYTQTWSWKTRKQNIQVPWKAKNRMLVI